MNSLLRTQINMKVNKLHLNKLIVILNILYFGKASSTRLLHLAHDFAEEEASGMGDNLMPLNDPFHRVLTYEQKVLIMEEQIKSLSKNVDDLGLKMASLLNGNMMDRLEQTIRKSMEQIVEEKNNRVDKVIDEEMKLMSESKTSYNVHKVKCSNNRFPTSCQDFSECSSNIYNIMVPEFSNTSFPAVCDLKTADGGWTIIQRRQDGSENFYRNWTEYVEGFGNMNGEFFIGLEKLHALTSLGEPQELYIILEDFEGQRRYARYGKFKVDSKNTEYKLIVDKYSGNAGDCFTQHNGRKFSTKDRDNDDSTRNCATIWKGAWWYSKCFDSNLNGLYLAGKAPASKRGVAWCSFRGEYYSLKFAQMMIRSKRD